MAPHRQFKRLVPRAGMIYEFKEDIFGRQRRDISIMRALENGGFVTVRTNATPETKKKVDEALAEVFRAAMQPSVLKHLTSEGQGVFGFFRALKSAVPWIARLGFATLTHLSRTLVAAREAWHANQRPPFDFTQHCATAKEIDKIIHAAKDRWSAEYEAYFVLRGRDVEEMAEMMTEVRGGGELGADVQYVEEEEEEEEDDDDEEDEYEEEMEMEME